MHGCGTGRYKKRVKNTASYVWGVPAVSPTSSRASEHLIERGVEHHRSEWGGSPQACPVILAIAVRM